MSGATLQYHDKEYPVGEGVTSIGRTTDNQISFPDDSNISRYHAEIEVRNGEYVLIDLQSSNGTMVNGRPISRETYLRPGDVIVLGGTSTIVFESTALNSEVKPDQETAPEPTDLQYSAAASGAAADAAESGGSGKLFLIAGAICCVALLFVAAAGALYYFSRTPECSATAAFIHPEQGDTIDTPTDIEIDVKNGNCLAGVVYTVDGRPFARSEEIPYSAAIDPRNFPDLADGIDHELGVILIDRDGNQISQPNAVRVAFETRRLTRPEQQSEIATGPQQPIGGQAQKEMSLIELQQLVNALASRFSGGRQYNVSNQQFLLEVRKRTADYAKPGYFEKASKYRDAINVAYAREQNLDAALGYLLAMSRSRFEPAKQGDREGLWQMSTDFVASNGYNGLCGTESLSDPSQNCAAKASALYMKAIVLGVFEGDMVYSVAAFGKSPQDAGTWKSGLPANRVDVWNSIKTAPEREQLVRFFAAGVVAENPQKFGISTDRPLSELYRLTL